MTWIECESGPSVMVTEVEGRIVVATPDGEPPVLTPAEARRLATGLAALADRLDPSGVAPPAPGA